MFQFLIGMLDAQKVRLVSTFYYSTSIPNLLPENSILFQRPVIACTTPIVKVSSVPGDFFFTGGRRHFFLHNYSR